MILTRKTGSLWYAVKINVLGIVSLSLMFAAGCLELKSSNRQPATDANDCAGVSCWSPPPNTCTADDALLVYAPSGYCGGGECSYATRPEQCHSGVCDRGECVNTPCQGVFCYDPPPPACVNRNRAIYAPSGFCSDGECSYAAKITACDYLCEAGACIKSPCAEVFCRKPPAPHCQDEKSLVVFEPEGRCAVVGDRPKCLHKSHAISCDHGCENGRCQEDPCVGVNCDHPPARYCDGAELVMFEPHGVCDEGGFCVYAEQRLPCMAPCVDAHCGENEACDNVTCNEPPAAYCLSDSELRVYAHEGICEDGFCSYLSSDIPCPTGCEDGRCKGDPCLGVSCEKPPVAYCDGKILVSFSVPGTCTGGWCVYDDSSMTCSNDCRDGACVNEGTDDVEWISLPGGTFEMGSLVNPDEQPVHSVDVPGFEMARTETTVDQYMECVTQGPCTEPSTFSADCYWNRDGFGSFPVNCVSWNQAATFCQWIGGRLPSEAQWEYAARSPGKNSTYPWGEDSPSCDYTIFNEGGPGCGTGLPWEVCSKPAGNTEQGLCDMSGNLMEWVQDTWHNTYEGAPADGSAWEGGGLRVTRGASFVSSLDQMRSADRGPTFDATYHNFFLGFRCIREVQ